MYDGRNYKHCAFDPSEGPWCPTKLEDSGNASMDGKHWGLCGKKCPLGKISPTETLNFSSLNNECFVKFSFASICMIYLLGQDSRDVDDNDMVLLVSMFSLCFVPVLITFLGIFVCAPFHRHITNKLGNTNQERRGRLIKLSKYKK